MQPNITPTNSVDQKTTWIPDPRSQKAEYMAPGEELHVCSRMQGRVRTQSRLLKADDSSAPKMITLRELMGMKFAELTYVIPELIPEGFTLFAGRAKLGKTQFWLSVAYAIARGGHALGCIPVEKCTVILLSLEDGVRSLQRRFKLLLGQVEDVAIPENLHIYTDWPNGSEGLRCLQKKIKEINGRVLVIVDTLKKFTGKRIGGKNEYDSGYEMGEPLHALVKDTNVSIIALHHTNKADWDDPFDAISGSMGLRGAVDTEIVMTRDKSGASYALLHGRGREVEEYEIALEFIPQNRSFRLMGDAREAQINEERRMIWEVIRDAWREKKEVRLKLPDIYTALKKNGYKRSESNVRHILRQMIKEPEKYHIIGNGKLGFTMDPSYRDQGGVNPSHYSRPSQTKLFVNLVNVVNDLAPRQ